MRIVILDGHATDQGDRAMWGPVQAVGEISLHARTPPAELVARCAGAEAVLTNKAPITQAHLAELPQLRYIGVTATGTNIVDLAAAKGRAVAVTNVPGYSTESVAQHVIALVLHFTNDCAGHSHDAKRGRWAAAEDFCFFRHPIPELHGRALAVVGMGAIGSAVARIAVGFGMRVLAAAVPGSQSPARLPLAEALAQADVVSLHCPLTERTKLLVDDRFLGSLKPGAILINTGRGGLLDEAACVRALAGGRLGGLGLDVLASEPPPARHPLLDPDQGWSNRVCVTPHVAWGSIEARRRLVAETAANLAAFVRGEARNRVA